VVTVIELQTAKVLGGELAFTSFGNEDAEVVIYAPHGITANMMTWIELAKLLPSVRIIAPDLRGRGRSNGLESPFGLRQHALDAVAVLDQLGVEKYHIMGHSMGGFVAVRLAAMEPDRALSVTLVDGGLPLVRPAGVSDSELVSATLGPAARRLEMVFDSEGQYLDFWRAHPAFKNYWSSSIEDYLKHDLEPKSAGLRPSASVSAVSQDILELFHPEDYLKDMMAISAPVRFVRAPRGLLNEDPLYKRDLSEYSVNLFSDFSAHEANDVNHYTILLGSQGSSQVAEVFNQQLANLRKVGG
jgi:lipase